MRLSRLISLFLITASIFHACGAMDAFAQAERGEKGYIPNEVLVRFRAWVDDAQKDSVRSMLRAERIKTVKSINVEYWQLPEDVTTEDALRSLKGNPSIEYAEPNYVYKPLTVPDDHYFNNQWYLENRGAIRQWCTRQIRCRYIRSQCLGY